MFQIVGTVSPHPPRAETDIKPFLALFRLALQSRTLDEPPLRQEPLIHPHTLPSRRTMTRRSATVSTAVTGVSMVGFCATEAADFTLADSTESTSWTPPGAMVIIPDVTGMTVHDAPRGVTRPGTPQRSAPGAPAALHSTVAVWLLRTAALHLVQAALRS